MSRPLTDVPTDAHSLPETVVVTALTAVTMLAAVLAASAPATAATVAATTLAVLGVQRARATLATRQRTAANRTTASGVNPRTAR